MRKHTLLISDTEVTVSEPLAGINFRGTSEPGCISTRTELLESDELPQVKDSGMQLSISAQSQLFHTVVHHILV